ncbi:hypothetical protein HJG53_06275 [Sphingomonas sp. ID1715]|uniref:hypothetical protein n=1 Tax=Sphingomonas sp. ID1715 TaxID=1656898 RepID=UPI0014877D71|nr:hypothetical protein [Sphingomonas sp. ID1715]NNM76508.1 hypothetical protein [Sphingomonas sp. ID1715]
MTSAQPSISPDVASLLDRLTLLERSASSELAIIEERLPELRRQAKARSKRRRGPGSPDAEKYKLGSILALLGFRGIDDLVLLGLLASGDRGLQWLAEARVEQGPMSFADLVRTAIADEKRADWCRAWGEYRWKAYKRPIYDAAVTSFLESGRTGEAEAWRSRDITDDQADIIQDICEAADVPLPDLNTRGEAFEWIREKGGNPAYWDEPEQPPEWED